MKAGRHCDTIGLSPGSKWERTFRPPLRFQVGAREAERPDKRIKADISNLRAALAVRVSPSTRRFSVRASCGWIRIIT